MPRSGPTTDHKEIRAWASRHKFLPVELLPQRVDHEPAMLQLMSATEVRSRKDVLVLAWDEFFARFDLLGLAFVYDDDHSNDNQLLQRDEQAPERKKTPRPHQLNN